MEILKYNIKENEIVHNCLCVQIFVNEQNKETNRKLRYLNIFDNNIYSRKSDFSTDNCHGFMFTSRSEFNQAQDILLNYISFLSKDIEKIVFFKKQLAYWFYSMKEIEELKKQFEEIFTFKDLGHDSEDTWEWLTDETIILENKVLFNVRRMHSRGNTYFDEPLQVTFDFHNPFIELDTCKHYLGNLMSKKFHRPIYQGGIDYCSSKEYEYLLNVENVFQC